MIIVEGSDCVGKTTLCKLLVEELHDRKLPGVYQHLGRLPDTHDRCFDYVDLIDWYVVQDRFFLSELVYARVRNESSPLTQLKRRIVESFFHLHGGFMLVLVASPRVIRKRYVAENEMYTLPQVLLANKLFSQYTCDLQIQIDRSSPDFQPLVEHIITEYQDHVLWLRAHIKSFLA